MSLSLLSVVAVVMVKVLVMTLTMTMTTATTTACFCYYFKQHLSSRDACRLPPIWSVAMLSRCQVMKSMAAKGRKLISGDAGAKLMQELTPTSGMSSRGG